MIILLLALLAGLLAWLGARWSLTLPYYERQRREIPFRTAITVGAAILLAGVAAALGDVWVSRLFLALWSVIFVLVTVIDIETHFIPNVIILPGTGGALLASLIDPRLPWPSALVGAVLAFVAFYVVVLVSRGGFGMGDAKLAAFVGAVTGAVPAIYALLAGILAGGVGAILLLASRRVGRRSFMPYGPYLCLGGWLGMLPQVVAIWGLQ